MQFGALTIVEEYDFPWNHLATPDAVEEMGQQRIALVCGHDHEYIATDLVAAAGLL